MPQAATCSLPNLGSALALSRGLKDVLRRPYLMAAQAFGKEVNR
jgi:hypothetical protein